jgi:hypothetical protein
MARSMSAGMLTEIGSTAVSPVFFMQFNFTTTVYFWTGIGNIVFNGATWSGSGDAIKLSPLQETAATEAVGVSFEIQGVTSDLISLALSEPIQGRGASVYIGFLDANEALISTPLGPFAYIMDTINITEDPQKPSITLTAESYLSTLEIPRPSRYTHEDQQINFAGDNGLIFVPSLQEKQILWGQGL